MRAQRCPVPVKMTTPMTHSVFRRVQPLSSRLEASRPSRHTRPTCACTRTMTGQGRGSTQHWVKNLSIQATQVCCPRECVVDLIVRRRVCEHVSCGWVSIKSCGLSTQPATHSALPGAPATGQPRLAALSPTTQQHLAATHSDQPSSAYEHTGCHPIDGAYPPLSPPRPPKGPQA
jgi:hypothetical protein